MRWSSMYWQLMIHTCVWRGAHQRSKMCVRMQNHKWLPFCGHMLTTQGIGFNSGFNA